VSDVHDLEATRRAHSGALHARLSSLVDRALDRPDDLAEPADQSVLAMSEENVEMPIEPFLPWVLDAGNGS
jgi:hypothetical protein